MIDGWKEFILADPGFYVGWFGLALGMLFGYVVYQTNYCAMGSISDIVNFEDYRRFRSWLLGAAVALLGAWGVQYLDAVDLSQSLYLTTNFNWLANVVGGLLFGIGMVFSGGCVSKNLVRAGAGDLRSLLVLVVIGVFAYMTIGGIFGLLRVNIFGPFVIDLTDYGMDSQSLGSLLSAVAGTSLPQTSLVATALLALAVLYYCLKDKDFRTSPIHLVAGMVIGICVIAGWFLTGLANDEFSDVAVAVGSLTFVRPTGDTLDYLMRYTALGAPTFGIVTLLGTAMGGFVAAITTGRFHLIGFADVEDAKRNMFGAALMGIGGVLGLGCTVGQALTGFSTLAMGSIITFAFIVIGGFIGIHLLNRILMNEA